MNLAAHFDTTVWVIHKDASVPRLPHHDRVASSQRVRTNNQKKQLAWKNLLHYTQPIQTRIGTEEERQQRVA